MLSFIISHKQLLFDQLLSHFGRTHESHLWDIVWILQYCKGLIVGANAQNPAALKIMQQKPQALAFAKQFADTEDLTHVFASLSKEMPSNFRVNLLQKLDEFPNLSTDFTDEAQLDEAIRSLQPCSDASISSCKSRKKQKQPR